MIVVVGSAALRTTPAGSGEAVGAAPGIAAAAAADGAVVEIVTKIGEDGAGEELLLALGRAGVGHLATLRDPARPTALARADGNAPDDDVDLVSIVLGESDGDETTGTGRDAPPPGSSPDAPLAATLEPADVALGLRYLRDYRVLVAVEPLGDGGAEVVAEAAPFAGAALVVVVQPGGQVPPAYATATLFEAPEADLDGAFAGLVGRYAAALDRGIAPVEAFRAATGAGGWEPAGG